ncbi:family 16 glycoside hydrolase [Haladaptatus sp. CMAA 1911]|uniref:family 16 glycoside hydrolase n=1 Tax=unclassified Haladaptatus TaxID=2622732 RepID=UPI003753FF16
MIVVTSEFVDNQNSRTSSRARTGSVNRRKVLQAIGGLGAIGLSGISGNAVAATDEDEWIQLFNGEDLDNWTRKFTGKPPGEGHKNTFSVEDGLLKVNYDEYDEWNGVFGHLFYENEFSHYILRAEYRFVGEQVSGAPSWARRNNGLMVHGQTPEEMGIDQDYPDSIEVQLLGEEAGTDNERTTANVCTPGTNIFMDGELHEQHCTNSNSDTYRGDEWVTVTVVVRGNQAIRHIVEDDGVVVSYTNPQLNSGVPLEAGTISIQSESHPTEFRSIEVKQLDPDSPIGDGDPTDTTPVWSSYSKTELASSLERPMAIEVAPDGRVFFTTRGPPANGDGTGTAKIRVVDPEMTEITTALEKEVYLSGEDGMQGIVLDPNFDQNGWLYVYYSVSTEGTGEDPHKQLSRFTVDGDTIDPSSEVHILRVPAAPEPCCHVGGDLEFGPEGHLYISVGDDTSPFESDGFSPIDERDGRVLYDAQRSAGNTADLRGGILRITPQDDGSYTVPDDNLFTEAQGYGEELDEGLVREEIYIMGCRNPFRMGIDDETGVLYWGEYGPDSRQWDAQRGPTGIVEFNRASEAGYYGWPYVIGPSLPYIDGEFVDADNSRGYIFDSTGEPFDPENLVNESPNNDGLTELPTPNEATIWYPYSWDTLLSSPPDYATEYLPDEPPFPEMEGGAPMGGPVYNIENYSGDQALADYFDNRHFIAEWGADWIKTVSYDENGEILDIDPFMPNETFLSPMDMTIGPEGALYLLEWGMGYSTPGTEKSGIYKITGGAAAVVSVSLESGTLGPEETTTATVSVQNTSNSELSDVQLSLESGSDQVQVTPPSETIIDSLEPRESQSIEFEVSTGSDPAQGTYTIEANAMFTHDGDDKQTASSTTITIFNGEPIEEGLEAHLPFDGDTPTNTVTGNDATIQGDVTTGESGVVGNAYEFHTNQETGVEIPPEDAEAGDGVTTEPLPLNGEGATAGAWINYTDHEQWARIPFQVGGSIEDGPTDGWDLEFNSNGSVIYPQLWQNGNTGRGGGGTEIAIDPETWYFVVMVVDGGDARLHVFDQDGELDASPQTWTGGSRTQSDAEPLNIGVGQGYDMAGRVDDVWAYSRALSEPEVEQLYTQSLEGDNDNGGVIEPGTTIKLGGTITGWTGQAPSSIEGDTNPTLLLQAGEDYTVTWENIDGAPHDFYVLDAQGEEMVGTELVRDEGKTASVTFTASEEMAEYYCSVHPTRMRGGMSIQSNNDGDDRPPVIVGDSRPTDPDGDGLYEDVDGDGEVTYNDVVALFDNFESSAVQNNPEAFDFNQNGQLDFDDIIELFNSM